MAPARLIAWVTILTLLAAVPARADCIHVSVAEGEVLTPEAAECLRSEVVRLVRERDDAEARRKEAETVLAATEATANITCPACEPQIAPVAIAAVLGVLGGVALTLAVLLGAR